MADMPLSEPLMLLDALLRGTVLALLLLLAAVLGRERSPAPVVRLGVLMALGLAVQVVAAMPWIEWQLPGAWQAPLVAVSVGNAVLFWLFVRALFDDDFVPRRRHALTWAAVAGVSGLNCLLHSGSGVPGVLAGFGGWTTLLQRVLPLVFAGLAIAAAVRHWRGDLVEGRRRLRLFIVVAGSAFTVAQLALRLASADGRLSAAGAGLDIVLTLAMVATIAVRLLRLGATELLPLARPAPVGRVLAAPAAAAVASLPAAPGIDTVAAARRAGGPRDDARTADARPADARPTEALSAEALPTGTRRADALPAAVPPDDVPLAPPPVADPADDRLAAALDHAMRDRRLYRGESLTIAGLAAQLDVPEYRLRRVINQRLGHRNFNAFVNAWRLQDAYDALADPRLRDRPVLTIALEAGFQSIGPFNRAFKAATGLTPSEFRQQKLADS
jgi:AraC-like DNA-binding protein